MKKILLSGITLSTLMLTACSGGMPKLFWSNTASNTPAYARGIHRTPAGKSRVPLDVPPELRQQLSVPMPNKVAVDAARGNAKMSVEEKASIAGKAVSLDARVYNLPAATVFSSLLDAMTALNMPVQSVDSPSGTITTTWIRRDASTASIYAKSLMNMFGGSGIVASRHRFIARVFRLPKDKSELQIRTLGQVFMNRHWLNKQPAAKVANELFTSFSEQIARIKKQRAPVVSPLTPAPSASAAAPNALLPNNP